ncbi:MAG: chemotaxis protein CheW [Elainellaceae cyanobacterium]
MKLPTPTIDNLVTQGNHYILTQVGDRQVAFSTSDVTGILLTERSQVLSLPFYDDVVLGIVHHQGQFVPLMMLSRLLDGKPGQMREVFNAIQLSESSGTPGLGLIIDQLLGHCSEEAFAADDAIEHFQPQMLDPDLWQPQRRTALSP